ncbi:hypothetical protein NHX12_001827 [Muraenolepis orangiensis]|uniref:CHK kinase-like domain-containing protein n=1 Tax=Muraenolepis orangiensis TaxID=630683 RepID=A0A9Q0IIJ1_9TELE|nr:hypothetical protein NHX12_001827 [Muraenolepis orangiensis]
MKQEYQDLILQACGASQLRVGATIQTLWSGYGEIIRVHLDGSDRPSVIVKHVTFPGDAERTDRSHIRKAKSYQVESRWYQEYSAESSCRIPACLAAHSCGDDMLLVLEDLDVAGFDQRRTSVNDGEIRACLSWLAHFHALFLGVEPDGLWPVGTYWHLETRPDELEAMEEGQLKAAAGDIDRMLNGCHFKTLVHGDAKLANFCFSPGGQDVAAVDFQYVGGGCGIKDVIYLLGSCLKGRECQKKVPGLLSHYFTELKLSVNKEVDFASLEAEWRELFAFAWADFDRFLLGWMPGHWKINSYSQQLTNEVLCKLKL